MFPSGAVSAKKDWFEFILDLNLLDTHLKSDNTSPDPSGCSLIVQFLYHANMTEQVYNFNVTNAAANNTNQAQPLNNTNPPKPGGESPSPSDAAVVPTTAPTPTPQFELKVKRIRMLRILAIKTAAILGWNLLTFEKEIPIAVMSDLLHIFLRLTMNEKETVLHSQLDLKQLDKQSIFALQLLHRWCLRVVIFSKFPKKPPTKLIPINMPGILNPLQHMKDANDSILKVLTNNVQESVEFLENLLKTDLSEDIVTPTTECFKNISSESGTYDIVWENVDKKEINEIKSIISYDLAMHYFQIENYEKAHEYFIQVNEYRKTVSEAKSPKFNAYTIDLDSYLIASRSVLNIESEQNEQINIKDLNASQIIKKIIYIEKCIKNDFKGIFEYLLEDTKTCQLSLSFRLNVEKIAQENQASKIVLDQIYSCNLVRMVCEVNNYKNNDYNLEQLKSLAQVVINSIDSLAPNYKSNLVSFVQLNFNKFSIQCQNELVKNKNFAFLGDSSKTNEQKDEEMMHTTPSSPPPSSSLINTLSFRDNTLVTFAKQSLQISDPVVIKNCVSKYNFNASLNNQNSSSNGLRYFWSKWHKFAMALSNPGDSNPIIDQAFLNTLIKTNSINDMDYFYICYAKANELIYLKKYNSAFNLVKSYENILNTNAKMNKLIVNQMLYLNTSKFLNEYEYAGNSVRKANEKLQLNQEQILKSCKNYLLAAKSDPDISTEILKSVLAYILTVGDFNLLTLNEISIGQSSSSHHKKTSHSNTFATSIFNLSKIVARLCIEQNKSDRNTIRKVARELWDAIVELFTDSVQVKRTNINQDTPSTSNSSLPYDASNSSQFFGSSTSNSNSSILISRDTKISFTNREILRKFLLSIKNKTIKNIIISLLSTLYNIADSMANNEIYSEYRYMWPSSLANANSLNLQSINDLINTILYDSLNNINPYNTNWLRTNADICMAKTNYSDAFKFYLQIIVCESRNFFKSKIIAKTGQQQIRAIYRKDELGEDKLMDEKLVKAMIKILSHLNKHTQAAILSQYLTQNNDYSNAFRYLQEGTIIQPTNDEMDLLYQCVWDITLLEYLANLNCIRGFLNKKNLCVKLCSSQGINPANPIEIFQKTVESKKTLFLQKLINHYFLI